MQFFFPLFPSVVKLCHCVTASSLGVGFRILMKSPKCSVTMNRIRFFAFLAMAPSVWSVGQCDEKGVCTVKVRREKFSINV